MKCSSRFAEAETARGEKGASRKEEEGERNQMEAWSRTAGCPGVGGGVKREAGGARRQGGGLRGKGWVTGYGGQREDGVGRWAVLTHEKMGAWWPVAASGTGGNRGTEGGEMTGRRECGVIEARLGRWYERWCRWKTCQWGSVVLSWEPPRFECSRGYQRRIGSMGPIS